MSQIIAATTDAGLVKLDDPGRQVQALRPLSSIQGVSSCKSFDLGDRALAQVSGFRRLPTQTLRTQDRPKAKRPGNPPPDRVPAEGPAKDRLEIARPVPGRGSDVGSGLGSGEARIATASRKRPIAEPVTVVARRSEGLIAFSRPASRSVSFIRPSR